MSLDHGLLNVPLAKRGNIDRDIDLHKKQQLLLAKQQAEVHHAIRLTLAAKRKRANELIAALPDEVLARLAKNMLIPKRSVRKRLRESAALYPATTLAALEREFPQ